MRISILGAGCVGCVIAEHIYKTTCGNELHFIAGEPFAKDLENNGVWVNDYHYTIPVLKPDEEKPDLVFVTVKNYDLLKACEDMRPLIDDHTILLPLLNSVSPTPTIQEIFPNNRVLYGYINTIDAHREGKGVCYHLSGNLHFGYANNKEIAPELEEIKQILIQSGINASIDEDMLRGVWKKWMLNVGANQVSALTECNYLQFAKIPEIENVLRLAMQELLTIASYEGVDLGTKDIADTLKYLTTYPYAKQTSMLQDILAHRRTEVDYISGDIIKLSHKWNCPCPVNLTMYYLIKSKQDAYLMNV